MTRRAEEKGRRTPSPTAARSPEQGRGGVLMALAVVIAAIVLLGWWAFVPPKSGASSSRSAKRQQASLPVPAAASPSTASVPTNAAEPTAEGAR